MSDLIAQLKATLAGRYDVQRELGRGGMATIFLAEDLKHHRRVAIKVLAPEVAVALGAERFLREIESAAHLSHPHILPLYDSGEAGGLLYYVMPFVEGESLRHRLEREKQLPLEDALRLTSEVADALDYAHRKGVVHRDIKPENILLQERHAVVADFGIARAIAAAGGEKLTTTGVIIGTPQYMSPEQVTASRDVDGRSDQYSLACVLYEMLAGEPPFRGPTGESLAHQHLNVAPRPVKALRTAVSEKVDRALMKALAKPAADRYSTLAEFAAALQSASAMSPRSGVEAVGTGSPPVRPARRGRWVGIAAAAVLVVLGTLALVRNRESLPGWLGGESAPPPQKKAWILVAEFVGPGQDSLVVASTRDLVIAALDQSEIAATVSQDQVRLALQKAGKPTSTRLDGDVAREIAFRSAVRTVLEGKVGRLGEGYSIVLRLTDVDSARVALSVSDAARSEDDLITTVNRITRKLRAELGERRSAIQATRMLDHAMTPSFEAYRAYARARRLLGVEDRAALAAYREAIALDPDFAQAWTGIGIAFDNLSQSDSALAAYHEALARPQRLTQLGRLSLESNLARTEGDAIRSLAVTERIVQLFPERPGVHNAHGNALTRLGRFSEALESFRLGETVSPFGASQVILNNQFHALLTLGRVAEARVLIPRVRGTNNLACRVYLAAAAGQWWEAESLATALLEEPSVGVETHAEVAGVLAAMQALRGDSRAADHVLRQVQSEAEAEHNAPYANYARWVRILLSLFSRGIAADPGLPGTRDSTAAGLAMRGLFAAAAGDTQEARGLLATIQRRPARDLAQLGFVPALLQSWVEARGGRWQEALHTIAPAALRGERASAAGIPLQSASAMRWMAAEAYEHLGQADSAAAYFERAIAAPPLCGSNWHFGRMAHSFGHRRLVLLYARMGRLENARRHWEIFSQAVTHSDPEMVRLVTEARAALANAEAMAKSARH